MPEYIDRDVVVDSLNKLCDRVCQYSKKQRKVMCGGCPLGDAFTVIEDAIPAADVRPVVRGKWISADDGKTVVRMKYGEPQNSCKCSVCGEWLVASDEYDVKGNYCPNCGADMREES